MIIYMTLEQANTTQATLTTSIFNISAGDLPPETLLSEEVATICQWLFSSVMCQMVNIFGSCTNVINIVCFVKQGLKDPVNVSLLGLAVADIGCLTVLVWTNICINPSFSVADLPFDPVEFQYLTGGMLRCTFTRVSAWITALITLERCLCIALPLLVKRVVTPKRVSIVIICVFIILMTSAAPSYVVNRLEFKFYPARNKTLLGLVFTQDREQVEQVSFAVNNVFIPFTAFVIIIMCTVTLVVKLKNKTKWRKTSSTGAQTDRVADRNHKVSKMVVMISSLFIACFIPESILFIVMAVVPEFNVNGKYRNILFLSGGFALVLESINSSVNIFIYYYMSSRYRCVFRKMFGLRSEELSKQMSHKAEDVNAVS